MRSFREALKADLCGGVECIEPGGLLRSEYSALTKMGRNAMLVAQMSWPTHC